MRAPPVVASNPAPLRPGDILDRRVDEVAAVCLGARPEALGVRAQEVADALVLGCLVVPVGRGGEGMGEEVVHDEALEEALAAGVLEVGGVVLEIEADVPEVQTGGVVLVVGGACRDGDACWDGGACRDGDARRHCLSSVCLGRVFEGNVFGGGKCLWWWNWDCLWCVFGLSLACLRLVSVCLSSQKGCVMDCFPVQVRDVLRVYMWLVGEVSPCRRGMVARNSLACSLRDGMKRRCNGNHVSE